METLLEASSSWLESQHPSLFGKQMNLSKLQSPFKWGNQQFTESFCANSMRKVYKAPKYKAPDNKSSVNSVFLPLRKQIQSGLLSTSNDLGTVFSEGKGDFQTITSFGVHQNPLGSLLNMQVTPPGDPLQWLWGESPASVFLQAPQMIHMHAEV